MIATIPRITQYSIEDIRADARYLVERGLLSPQQPIYMLLLHLPKRDHSSFEQALERNEYLLRDRIIDLLPKRRWQND